MGLRLNAGARSSKRDRVSACNADDTSQRGRLCLKQQRRWPDARLGRASPRCVGRPRKGTKSTRLARKEACSQLTQHVVAAVGHARSLKQPLGTHAPCRSRWVHTFPATAERHPSTRHPQTTQPRQQSLGSGAHGGLSVRGACQSGRASSTVPQQAAGSRARSRPRHRQCGRKAGANCRSNFNPDLGR